VLDKKSGDVRRGESNRIGRASEEAAVATLVEAFAPCPPILARGDPARIGRLHGAAGLVVDLDEPVWGFGPP
jgi:hypothetical protein